MNVLDILDALGVGEDKDWEFKRGTGGLPGSLWETYSSLANTDGGTIVLGVAEVGGKFQVVGLDDPAKMRSDFWNAINNRNKTNINLLTNNNVSVRTLDDKAVLVVRVPRATRRQRPAYVGQNPLTGTCRRNNEGDYRCTENEVRRMFSDASEESADSRILEHFTLDDIDEESLRQYRNRFSARAPDHPWLTDDATEFLRKLGAWRTDRATGTEGPTVAGLLMFGKVQAITDPLAVPSFHLDYRERLSDDPDVRWTDRAVYDGTWEANIFQFYLRVLPKLTAGLKTPFRLDADLFRRDETIVHEALREALVNALIHADHSGQAGVVVERHRDRYELSNPGTLLLPVKTIYSGGVSECRNRSLQTMFMMIGGGEKVGSGIDKILRGWASQHWRAPSIQETLQPERIKLILTMVSLLPEDALAWLRERYGPCIDGLEGAEVQALVTAYREGQVSNTRMQELISMHPADLTKMLQGLVGEGILGKNGRGRATYYTLSDKQDALPLLSGFLDRNSTQEAVDSTHSVADSPHNEGDSPHNEGDSTHKERECMPGSSALGSEELDELNAIAEVARRKRRLPREHMRRLIVALCQVRFLTAAELATLVGRSARNLRERFLKPMVDEELLIRKYPDEPNRPDQAYGIPKA